MECEKVGVMLQRLGSNLSLVRFQQALEFRGI